ncbi:unnamed protein product [Adineta ricciae]|uniref:CENP-V/GFA domain-containing protein n=1 Tax=Adineta ricciae TaxID=249248 RepID=A0A815ZU69_ADIRI|nr:unnamed protein product [Adineta ricciae]
MISFLTSKKLIGYCLCKDIIVKIDRESLTDKSNEVLLCHCSKCQRGVAGLASLDLMSLNGKVALIDEKSLIAKYDDTDTKLFTGEIDQLPCPMKDLFCGRMMKWEEEIDDAKYYNESAE